MLIKAKIESKITSDSLANGLKRFLVVVMMEQGRPNMTNSDLLSLSLRNNL